MPKIALGGGKFIEFTLGESGCTLEGNLHEMDNCGQQYCFHEDSPRDFNIALDGAESMLLALVSSGLVDISSPALVESIQTVLDKLSQEFDT